MTETRRSVALLGATGSIGRQTLEVLRRERDEFDLVSVAGGSRLDELITVAREFAVGKVGVQSTIDATYVRDKLPGVEVVIDALEMLAGEADVVVNAVVGFAGVPATLGALRHGRRLALANKESLVVAAPLVEQIRGDSLSEIVPIDSEHCALHQCLVSSRHPGHPDVRRLLLTASGGPFRGRSRLDLLSVTKAEALQHPTWSMGPKITIDSSTLMNKGLEVLEASALFGVEVGRIDVVVHPQSLVHSMVEYVDGSTLAQLSWPDMRLPIAYALGQPVRLAHGWGRLAFDEALTLTFEPPDRDAFPALGLAYAAGERGGAAPAWLSAANEVAVEAFLNDRIAWHEIIPLVARTMDHYIDDPLTSVEGLYENDAESRRRTLAFVQELS
jgi:1-deoxy-D-xylulose-5-phosphate reductoisomerase